MAQEVNPETAQVDGQFQHVDNGNNASFQYAGDNTEAQQADEQKSLEALAEQEKMLDSIDKPDSPLTKQVEETPEPEKVDEAAEDTKEEAAEESTEEKASLDYEALTNEFAENGALSEDSYKALEDLGIPKSLVDAHISGLQAIQQAEELRAFSMVGGEDSYKSMIEWAGDTLSQDGIQEFNDMVNKGGREQERAIKELHQQYVETFGHQGNMLQGGQGVTTSNNSYSSMAQLMADQADPRYATDPAFREQVWQKLSRSNI